MRDGEDDDKAGRRQRIACDDQAGRSLLAHPLKSRQRNADQLLPDPGYSKDDDLPSPVARCLIRESALAECALQYLQP